MELNIQQIMEILPHRPPFLLVDKIVDCEPGVKATGIKCVTMNEPFFTGHFPGQPIMPGVLILEALAQTGAVAALSLPENKGIRYNRSTNDKPYRGFFTRKEIEVFEKQKAQL